MTEIPLEKIVTQARQLAKNKQSWHFHILTPECQLNDGPLFALILESRGGVWVNHSEQKPMVVGQELVKLLHGQEVVGQRILDSGESTSSDFQRIIEKAKKLSSQNIFWHHHLLFPDCQFNKHPGQWTLLLEDPRSQAVWESLSETEPKADLKQIETLFYSQNNEL